MSILENESLVVNFAVAQDPAHTVSVGGPVGYGDRVAHRLLAIVARRRVLGDDVVGHHASCIADVELAREVVVVRKLVEAVSEARPFLSELGLANFVNYSSLCRGNRKDIHLQVNSHHWQKSTKVLS